MLVTLGKPRTADDLVESLAACHERIRRFLMIAHRVAMGRGAPSTDLRDAAGQVRRYFAGSLLQHIADEDLIVAPHLHGRAPHLDAALATMSADHVAHAGAVARVVALAAAIEDDPRRIEDVGDDLEAAATALDAHLLPHLELEERTIFPALRALPDGERRALQAAIRERRTETLARSGVRTA